MTTSNTVPIESGESQPMTYVAAYIRRALNDSQLASPDRAKAGAYLESLIGVHDAHKAGGVAGAREAWGAVKRLRPELAEIDPEEPVIYKPDDDMIAIELAKQIGERARFFHNEWKVNEGGCWQGQKPNEFRRHIRRELRLWRGRGVTVSQNRIKSLASMLEDDLFVPDKIIMERQREQANYINLRNGLFNLETFQLEKHRPDLYFTTQLDFDYKPDAGVTYFWKYLNSSLVFPDGSPDPKLANLALEAVAYSMTARTDLKSSFWLVGQKDSGKSTFIALLKALMGDLHATIDLTQLGANRFLLAGIVGKRVITFTEASSGDVIPDALYKTLVGGSDEVYADVKNRDPITFRPEAKVWWAMNEMPRTMDRSGATTRRIIMFPFKRTVAEKDRIGNLEHKLSMERSGIFNLVVNALQELMERGGFTVAKQSEEMRQEYILENDTELTFVEECMERKEGARIGAGLLYNTYSEWCLENGFKPKNSNQVAKEWRRLGFTALASSGKHWVGLRLPEIIRDSM